MTERKKTWEEVAVYVEALAAREFGTGAVMLQMVADEIRRESKRRLGEETPQ